MDSITKNRQSPDTLRAMVARGYGADLVPADEAWATELGHGWFNAVYRIDLRDGRRVVLKIAPPAHVELLTFERGAMAVELAARRLIGERTSVPVPEVDFTDQSRLLCDADYFFTPYVDADNLGAVRHELPAAELARCQEALGAVNRELNGICGAAFGSLAGPGHASWRAAFTAMAEGVLADGERRSVDLGCPSDRIRDLVAAHGDALDEVVEPRFVEWDLAEDNVLVRDGAIVAVIDHERAFYGDPLMEYGFAGLVFPGPADEPSAFLRGYGRGPLSQTELTRRRLYTLHLLVVLVVKAVYRQYVDTRPYLWARERLAEVVAPGFWTR